MNKLPSLSLSILKTLDSLLRTRSVTKTAIEVGLTQSAVSLTLKKIRHELGDKLLVRSGSNLVLTARAQTLAPKLHKLLSELSTLLEDTHEFDARTTTRSFSIAVADCVQCFFLPKLIAHMQACAPQATLYARSITRDFDFFRALQDGSLDVVVGNWPNPPNNLRIRPLFEDTMVCLARKANPLSALDAMDMTTYLEQQHVAPEPYLPDDLGPVDGALQKQGLSRKIAITVPEFSMASHVVAKTDLIFTSSKCYALHHANVLDLKIISAPLELGLMNFYLLWHDRVQNDSAVIWLKNQIIEICRQFNPENWQDDWKSWLTSS